MNLATRKPVCPAGERCRQPVATPQGGAGWITPWVHCSRAGAPVWGKPEGQGTCSYHPLWYWGNRLHGSISCFQGHHTEDERTEFLKDSVALLTRAFLTPLMKEVSCGPSQREVRSGGCPVAHIKPFLHSPSLISRPLSVLCQAVPASLR